MLCLLCSPLCLLLILRLAYVLFQIHRPQSLSPPSKHTSSRLLCVAGSGGHTAELLQLLSSATLAPSSKTPSSSPYCVTYSPRHYIVAETDSMSQNKIETFEKTLVDRSYDYHSTSKEIPAAVISRIPRAREVGQSYLTSILSTLHSQLSCIPSVVRARPDLVLVNGPGTCIPVCILVFMLRVLGYCGGRVVYVESICRVSSLSLSGRILLYFADHVLVQWPQLAQKYHRCRYIGRLVS